MVTKFKETPAILRPFPWHRLHVCSSGETVGGVIQRMVSVSLLCDVVLHAGRADMMNLWGFHLLCTGRGHCPSSRLCRQRHAVCWASFRQRRLQVFLGAFGQHMLRHSLSLASASTFTSRVVNNLHSDRHAKFGNAFETRKEELTSILLRGLLCCAGRVVNWAQKREGQATG